MWQKWFSAIARANAAMHSDSIFTGFTTGGLKERLIAEAKFVRAFAYFQLVISFGDVPLINSYIASTTTNVIYPRSATTAVYAQIEKDLLNAAPILPLAYTGADLGRATRWGCLHAAGQSRVFTRKNMMIPGNIVK